MSLTAEDSWLLAARGDGVKDFFQELGVTIPDRPGADVDISCFASPEAHKHDDRHPSCSVNLISGLWHCKGCGERGNAFQAAQILGYPDRRAAELARKYGLFLNAEPEPVGQRPRLPAEPALVKQREALRANQKVLNRLWEVKAWTLKGIWRCGVGWDGERIVFTIRDQTLRKVGVVRYLPGGKPKTIALPGSKRNLFPAPEVFSRRRPIYLVEGEPDAVAVCSIGSQAVSVPGTGSWRSEWGMRFGGHNVIVLADCDTQGRGLAERIRRDMPSARIVDLEPGRSDGYDIGSMIKEASVEGGAWQVRHILERVAACD